MRIDDQDVTGKCAWQRADMVARVCSRIQSAGTCEALTIEENMALAWSAGAKRDFHFSLNKTLRELFREKLSILKLGLENRLADRIGLLSGGQRQAAPGVDGTVAQLRGK